MRSDQMRRHRRRANRTRFGGVEPLEARRVLDSTVVFNEIMYNPAGAEETLEYVELYNQMAVDMDISAWSLQGGVDFEFPEGTVVAGGGYLVVAKDPAALATESGFSFAMGPFAGQLSNTGESIELRDRNDRRMDVMEFNDRGQWPVAPDGSGASLAKIEPMTTSGPAQHWTSSVVVGGTPGRRNFPEQNLDRSFLPLVSLDAQWTYQASGAFPGDGWNQLGFDDANWMSGAAPFFAGDVEPEGPEVEQITGVLVTASSELAGFDRQAAYVVNGSGLNGNAHGITPDGSMWLNQGTFGGAPADRAPEITFDLGQIRELTEMKVWNYNENLANRPELLARGVSSADVLVAGDNQVFTVLIANQQFDKAPGTQTDFSQSVDLGGVAARFVKLDIHDNFPGGDAEFVGLSEVQFLAKTNPLGSELPLGPTTYYYRTEFEFTGDPQTADLLLSGIVDDGAVVYLNGTELHRQNMPSGDVGPTTVAASRVDTAQQSDVIQLSGGTIVRGRNVLAVEIHQAEANDDDMVFGLELNALAVALDPDTVSSLVSFDDVWRYEASGADLGTEWRGLNFDDSQWSGGPEPVLVGYWPLDGTGDALVGENGQLEGDPVAAPDRNGMAGGALGLRGPRRQYVDIPGGGGLDGATTGTISMWVQWIGLQDFDCCGPTYGAVLSRQSNRRFSDNIIALDSFEPNDAHVVWRQSGNPAPVAITGTTTVGSGNWRHIALTFSAEQSELFVDGISQGTAPGDALNSNPDIPLSIGAWSGNGGGFATGSVDDVAIWDGVLTREQIAALAEQTSAPLDYSGPDQAPYVAGDAAEGNTMLPLGTPTYYFRKEFTFDQEPSRTNLIIDSLVDDGAVYYVNGAEVLRSNMPDGPVSFDTLASQPVDAAVREQGVVLSGEDLVVGTNVLAVEVHQASPTDSDVAFDMQLMAVTTPPGAIVFDPPRLAVNETSGGEAGDFWLELMNFGEDTIDLNGYVVASSGDQRIVLAGPTIAPGRFHVVDPSQLGFEVEPGDRVYLYAPDESLVVSAAEVGETLRGRSPDGTGPFLFPDRATPGETNSFDFHTEVVINEIMYNAPATPGAQRVPPTIQDTPLVMFDSTWRYSRDFNFGATDLPIDPGPDWANEAHPADSTDWFENVGPLGFFQGRLPERINKQLANPLLVSNFITTYYFETEFGITQDQIDTFDEVALSHMIDDGAVFYVNGHEVHRSNLPEGTIDSHTLATAEIGTPLIHEFSILAKDHLVALPEMNRVSVEVHQGMIDSPDFVFGAELLGRTILDPGKPPSPYVEDDEEWVELHNRADSMVDLSGWQLDDAVRFEFPSGTMIAPGEYLVVAKDAAALTQKYPGIAGRILGDYTGELANRTDRLVLSDARGNPADSVEYFEDGNWPSAADGAGSSLELRDPGADNSVGSAWGASLEGDDTPWTTYSYQGLGGRSSIGPDGQWHELVLGLLSPGVMLLDNIRVIQDPNGDAIELIQNGKFDNDTTGDEAVAWRIIGNHRHSEVVADPDDPANQVLRLVATGATEHMHNHAETTLKNGDEFVDIENDVEYRISFRAKSVSGSNQLNTRLYFNRLARTTLVERSVTYGTPGRQNSVLVENLGPTYAALSHSPAVPQPGEPITVAVSAHDPDSVADVTLWYSIAEGPWISTLMVGTDDRQYSGLIPGQQEGVIVQFYVEGRDAPGMTSQFPAGGPNSRALLQVNDALAESNGLHNVRLILTPTDADLLHSEVELMSNDRIGATVIYNESEIFYNAGIRLSGSQRARPFQPRLSFSIAFKSDQLFRGVHGSVILDRSESTFFGQRELIYHHGMNHAGGLPSEYNDLVHIITPRLAHTGSAEMQMARVSDVFLEEQFENGGQGQLYEYELTYYPTTTADGSPEGRKRPQPDSTRSIAITDLGENKEDYRWAYLNKNNRTEDTYDRLIEFTAAMGQRGDAFLETIGDFIDVDQWLRAFALGNISGHGDNYSATGDQHNLHLYIRPSDQRVLQFPHDLDAFFSATRPLVSAGDLRKLIADPANEHMYYGHVDDMIQTTFNEEYMGRWTEHFGSFLPQQSFENHLSELVRRSEFLEDQIRAAAPEVEFALDGEDLAVEANQITLSGTGWVNVRQLRLAGSQVPLAIEWTDVTNWHTTVPVAGGENQVTIEAYDFQGNLIGSDSITVTSTVDNPVKDSLRITELNFNPSPPTSGELTTAPSLDNDDFEFIELTNTGASTLNLLGASFTDGVSLVFLAVELAAGQSAVVVHNESAFRLRYGAEATVLGVYEGRLNNAGESTRLEDANGQTISDFAYDDGWYLDADAGGYSLTVADSATDLNLPSSWRPSITIGGSPGGPEPFLLQPGDANRDQTFNQQDLVLVLRGGKYNTDEDATWSEGDWTGDGVFNRLDIILSLQSGHYRELAAAATTIRRAVSPEIVDAILGVFPD